MLNRVGAIALTASLAFTATAFARDTDTNTGTSTLRITHDTAITAETRVIDIRNTPSCTAGSLPRARCLPVDHFIDPTGRVIGFHALRWLLGTIGLKGEEAVLVIGDHGDDAQKVGTLLHHAGQARVLTFDKPFRASANAPAGTPRSLSRETVFTAPMRADLN